MVLEASSFAKTPWGGIHAHPVVSSPRTNRRKRVGEIITDPQAKAVEAGGKAVTELSKTVSHALDLTSKLGGYLAKIVGTVPEDIIGVAGGDYLHHQRRRNLAAMAAKTAKRIEEINGKDPALTEPSASLVVPLLQAAADENREELQELWAALLARAMTGGGRRIRRQFFSVLHEMEPADALVLVELVKRQRLMRNSVRSGVTATVLGVTMTEWLLSLEHLVELGCAKDVGGATVAPTNLAIELVSLTQIEEVPAASADLE